MKNELFEIYLETVKKNPLKEWTPSITKYLIEIIESKIQEEYEDLTEYEKIIAIKNDVLDDIKLYFQNKIKTM